MDLSIVIVSWNTKAFLDECLRSVLAETVGLASETIVVDNASSDGSVEMVSALYPDVRLIKNSGNAGYSRANNQGLAVSTGRYVLLLNSDTLIYPGAISRLSSFLDMHPDCGAVGTQLILPDGSPQPFSYGKDPTIWYLVKRGLNRLVFHRYLHQWGDQRVREVDWVSGACLMLRRQALDEVGWLDERFFMYFEDNDLCLRLRKNGWKVFRFPQVQVVHSVGKSLEQNTAARAAYHESLVHFYRKHYGRLSQLALRVVARLWVSK